MRHEPDRHSPALDFESRRLSRMRKSATLKSDTLVVARRVNAREIETLGSYVVAAFAPQQLSFSKLLIRWRARRDSNSRPLPSECNGLLLIGNRRHGNAQQAGPACPAIDLEKNWRRKDSKLAYSVQAIDLIGAP